MKRFWLLGLLLISSSAFAASYETGFNHDVQYVDTFAAKTEPLTGPLQNIYDYGNRSDGQPVYSGQAVPGVAQGTTSWIIYKYTYDGSTPANLTLRQTGYGSWTNRASVTYS